MQHPSTDTGGQCGATEPAAAEKNKPLGLKTTEESDASDKQMHNARDNLE